MKIEKERIYLLTLFKWHLHEDVSTKRLTKKHRDICSPSRAKSDTKSECFSWTTSPTYLLSSRLQEKAFRNKVELLEECSCNRNDGKNFLSSLFFRRLQSLRNFVCRLLYFSIYQLMHFLFILGTKTRSILVCENVQFEGYFNINFVKLDLRNTREDTREAIYLWSCSPWLSCTTFHEIKVEISFKLYIFRQEYLNAFALKKRSHLHRCKKVCRVLFWKIPMISKSS